MRDPTKSPCYCRPGYKCSYCEQQEEREAKEEAQRREVEDYIEAQPGDEYNPPQAGGCWFCKTGDGEEDEDMAFDIEFDTFYHPECLDERGVVSVVEYEMQRDPNVETEQ